MDTFDRLKIDITIDTSNETSPHWKEKMVMKIGGYWKMAYDVISWLRSGAPIVLVLLVLRALPSGVWSRCARRARKWYHEAPKFSFILYFRFRPFSIFFFQISVTSSRESRNRSLLSTPDYGTRFARSSTGDNVQCTLQKTSYIHTSTLRLSWVVVHVRTPVVGPAVPSCSIWSDNPDCCESSSTWPRRPFGTFAVAINRYRLNNPIPSEKQLYNRTERAN